MVGVSRGSRSSHDARSTRLDASRPTATCWPMPPTSVPVCGGGSPLESIRWQPSSPQGSTYHDSSRSRRRPRRTHAGRGAVGSSPSDAAVPARGRRGPRAARPRGRAARGGSGIDVVRGGRPRRRRRVDRQGEIEIVKRSRVLATLGPGAVVGELAMFVPSAARTATARATTDVRMIKWRAEDVAGRLARHERLATAIVADLAFVLAERLDRRHARRGLPARHRRHPAPDLGPGAVAGSRPAVAVHPSSSHPARPGAAGHGQSPRSDLGL